jgi:hypothetical protein
VARFQAFPNLVVNSAETIAGSATRVLVFILFFVAFSVSATAPSEAQSSGFPLRLRIVFTDPVLGPFCDGPLGPGPCEAVGRYIRIQSIAAQIHLPVLRVDPFDGPICPGPLGPGPCGAVKYYMAMQQVAQAEIQLTVLRNAPGIGPICAGPLGDGPCEAIRMYLMQNEMGGASLQQFDPRQATVVTQPNESIGAMCNGPFGQMPCDLAGQISLDRAEGPPPPPASFNLPANLDSPQKLAQECARRVGLDVSALAGCTGQQIMLPQNQMAVLDCAVQNSSTIDFANCAAPKLGIELSDDQRLLAALMHGNEFLVA